jgi:N-acetylneuraminic acid mutarotase
VIYVIGGQTASGTTANVEALDLRLDRWSLRAPKPTAVANVGAALVGDRIYVPGGYSAAGRVVSLLEVYNPADDTWSRAAALPMPLCAYAIAAYEYGFYVFGGWDGERYLDQVLHYDARADRWQVVGTMGEARGFLASTVADDRIYLLGGYDDRLEYDLVESFDPARLAAGEDPWEQHTAMDSGRAGHAAVAIDGQIYVVGGGWEGYLAHNLRYDVANDVWSTFETPILGEWRTLGLSGTRAEDGSRLYAIGGWTDRFLGIVQVYQASYRLYLP